MKESFEQMVSRYRAELMKLAPKASVPLSETAPIESTAPTPEASFSPAEANTDTGFLQISLSTARQSIPLSGGLVTVTQTDGAGNRLLLYVLRTDAGGRAPKVSLPAPPRSLSEVPGNDRPFALYDIRAECAQYVGQIIRNVHIFGGITSNMAVELVPTLLPAVQVADTERILPTDSMQNERGA